MLYCRCGQYLLWERDHWACQGCGASPWRCECPSDVQKMELKRIDYGDGSPGEVSEKEGILKKVFG